jgi:DNA-binding NarL/FixJ family response regulator
MTAEANVTVLIVDDHHLIAQGIAFALRAEGVDAVVSTELHANGILGDALRTRPQVVLLDLQFEGPMGAVGDGRDLIGPLTELGAHVLVLTGVTDRPTLGDCLERGATGVMAKSEPFETLVDKVLVVARGGAVLSEQERCALLAEHRHHVAHERDRLAPFSALTPREADVLVRLMAGLQADRIAEDCYVSLATIRSQIRSILQKLSVNSQLAAVAVAREAGWQPRVTVGVTT